jgi:hypothetical protein
VLWRPDSPCRVLRRPSATFLVLEPAPGAAPEPGAYSGEVEFDGVRAPCAIRICDQEYWCQLRGPLPRAAGGERATLRFGARR